MSSIACPHCAQNFNNYNNGIKANKCPYCGGGIGYVEGNPILDKSIFINHFWKIAIVLSIMALIGGIIEGNEWYEIIGLMVACPILGLLLIYFLSKNGPEYPIKK